MIKSITAKHIAVVLLAFMLVAVPAAGAGCEEEPEETAPAATTQPASGLMLSSTLVPDTDFDVYVYLKQEEPTVVSSSIVGTPADVSVIALALWGVAGEDAFTFGGALTFTGPDDAGAIHDQVTGHDEIWKLLSGRTIYFVHGSGQTLVAMKSAISENDFKVYDDEAGLVEMALLPDGGTTRLAGIAIARPSSTLVRLIARKAAPEASGLLDVLLKTANLQVITAGLYSAEQIDTKEITDEADLAGILEMEVGILASVKSAWPGVVVSPIVGKALESAGYEKAALGELTVYQGNLELDSGERVPVVMRVEGNRLFAAVSRTEAYAEMLISSVNL